MLRNPFAILPISLCFLCYCAQPSKDKIDLGGAKASLRLADGSTISRNDAEDYSPYLFRMDDGYLVLVFGSNRIDCSGCTGHNIFVTRSLTPFHGVDLPHFAAPVPVISYLAMGPANNAAYRLDLAASSLGASVRLFWNDRSDNNIVKTADITNFTEPTISSWNYITNTAHYSNTIIGITTPDARLYSLDYSGIAYVFDPMASTTESAFGTSLDYALAAAPVRMESSGYANAFLAIDYGSVYAATDTQDFGTLEPFDASLAMNSLDISSMSTFTATDPAEDLLLFSATEAVDGTEDLYLVTSHTMAELWGLKDWSGNTSAGP